jgi:hypothetical protein
MEVCLVNQNIPNRPLVFSAHFPSQEKLTWCTVTKKEGKENGKKKNKKRETKSNFSENWETHQAERWPE